MVRRLGQLLVLFVAMLSVLGAASSRFDALGHKLMCPCGCGEILLECNHVGCPDSDRMIGELRTQLGAGSSDGGVLNWFVGKYGPTVLAAPIRGGFDTVAWVVPFAALMLGITAVVVLLRMWKSRQLSLPGVPGTHLPSAENESLRERIRRDTHWG